MLLLTALYWHFITFVVVDKISNLIPLYACELPLTLKCSAIETLFQISKQKLKVMGMLPWIFSSQRRDAGRATSFFFFFFGSILSLHQAPFYKNLSLGALGSRTKQGRSFRGLWTFTLEDCCWHLPPRAISAPLASSGLQGCGVLAINNTVGFSLCHTCTHPLREVMVPIVFLVVNIT